MRVGLTPYVCRLTTPLKGTHLHTNTTVCVCVIFGSVTPVKPFFFYIYIYILQYFITSVLLIFFIKNVNKKKKSSTTVARCHFASFKSGKWI